MAVESLMTRGVNRMVRHDIDSHTQRYDICRYLKKLYDLIQEYIDRYYEIIYLF